MDGESCIKKAYEFIFNSDFEQAIYWFEQAIAADPNNASYYHKCAVSCARSGKWAKAKLHADAAVKLDPEHPEYHYHLQTVEAGMFRNDADLLLASDPPKLSEAAELLKRAAALDPLSFEAFYKLGVVYSELNRLDEAAASAKEAMRLDPAHSAARRLLADVNRKRRLLRVRINARNRKRNR
ncbi:tetratricopeptide repeat protein [Paenibacillus arenilitoris]|uniref:Tetratricopeptide repeat protein n=1 Tax=Paenibacillus arenilitoris TaxID=2772299 RepID=A0A927H5P8_9BACL|nr:tetratricopeptide repeat protein [Paenibacillus arenilitoris]MBD2869686.1 tetratricopeptide repeat protein [Paenibacillus arenilitoris]